MSAALSAPNTKRGCLQRTCLEILRAREDEPDGLPTSTRFIYYELVQRGVIAKKSAAGATGRRSDQDVADAIFFLRKVGEIPWEWIADETRSIDDWRYARSVAEYVKDTVDKARIDVWSGVAPPMILTESRSLAGVLRNLAYAYLVPIAATNGQVGGFLRTDVAPTLCGGQRVLYLGDWDWQGAQIETNTRTVLEELIGDELDWRRLAITEAQVRANDLPVISKPDRRYKPVRHHDAVETEALGQSVIVGIVRDHLDGLLPEPLPDVHEREEAQRAKVRTALARIARSAP
jgi:hypothetical protein